MGGLFFKSVKTLYISSTLLDVEKTEAEECRAPRALSYKERYHKIDTRTST